MYFIKGKRAIEITYMKDADAISLNVTVDADKVLNVDFVNDCLILIEQAENKQIKEGLICDNVIAIIPVKNLISLSTSNVG